MSNLLTGLSLGTFAAFAWGYWAFFRRPRGVAPALRLLNGLTVVALAGQLATLSPGWPAAGLPVLATVLYGLSLGLWGWAVATTREAPPSLAFSGDTASHLILTGPFRHVRHPFYMSYILFWLAGSVATLDWRAWLPAIPVVLGYLVAARNEERAYVVGPLAVAYRHYRARTGMFLPRLPRP